MVVESARGGTGKAGFALPVFHRSDEASPFAIGKDQLAFHTEQTMAKASSAEMGQMGWSAFHQAYPHACMLFVDLDKSVAKQARFQQLRTVVAQLGMVGRYAMLPEEALIRVAFEREADAVKVADALQARRTAREGGWAGQWAMLLDRGAVEKIESILAAVPKRARPGNAGSKLKSRFTSI
jgi:hypothetical protein